MRKIGSKYHIFAGLAVIVLGLSITPYVVRAESGSGRTQTTIKIEGETSGGVKTSVDDSTKLVENSTSGSSNETEVETEHSTEVEHRQGASTVKSTTAEQRQAQLKTKLADNKLKVCQRHEKTITNIMSRLRDRGTKQLDVFGKIADRTEAFYVKSGKSLSNYDVLVADVATKKAAAQTAVASLKSTSTTFDCNSTDPKGVAAGFKDSLKAEISALNDYKTAIKNLIVGVKSVQSTASTSTTEGGEE
jgi:hypothetical protein